MREHWGSNSNSDMYRTETSTTHTVKSHKAKLIVIVRACRDDCFGWIENLKNLCYKNLI